MDARQLDQIELGFFAGLGLILAVLITFVAAIAIGGYVWGWVERRRGRVREPERHPVSDAIARQRARRAYGQAVEQ